MASTIADALVIMLLVSVLGGLVVAAFLAVRRSRAKRIRQMPNETGDAHGCAPDSFSILVMLDETRIDTTAGSQTLPVFTGIYCSGCRRELCCEKCGKTPDNGAVMANRAEASRAATCCASPAWALRHGGKTLAHERAAKAAPAEDPFRWN